MGAERTGSLRRRLRRSVRRLGRRVDLRRLASRREDGSPMGLRTAKTTLAAVISWELALRLPGSQPPVLAPLTALLVTQLTLVKTITGSLQRVASVTAGVLVALLVADLIGLHWWSVGLVIFLSLALGQVLKLGSHRMEVPISALLVMTLGGTPGIAGTRVLETLIGFKTSSPTRHDTTQGERREALGLAPRASLVAPEPGQKLRAAIARRAARIARYGRTWSRSHPRPRSLWQTPRRARGSNCWWV